MQSDWKSGELNKGSWSIIVREFWGSEFEEKEVKEGEKGSQQKQGE